MHKNPLIYLLLLSLHCFAQKTELVPNNESVIIMYHVEERINIKFGGYISTYYVENLKQIGPVDLGPGNIRIITPVYGKKDPAANARLIAHMKSTQLLLDAQKAPSKTPSKPVANATQGNNADWAISLLNVKNVSDTNTNIETANNTNPSQSIVSATKNDDIIGQPETIITSNPEIIDSIDNSIQNQNNGKIVDPSNLEIIDSTTANSRQNKGKIVDMIKTYERMVDKGFKSIEMLKKVGDANYFSGDMNKAAKYYKDLFDMTTDLANDYYLRYSRSLKAIGENTKADKFLKKYNELEGK